MRKTTTGHDTATLSPNAWVRSGAVFTYRGQPEKILTINAESLETVGTRCFYDWHNPSFLSSVADGEIVHAPRATLHTKPPKAAEPAITGELDPSAQEIFGRVYASFQQDREALRRMTAWVRAVGGGQSAEPWEHMLGVLLIQIGAEHRGLGQGVANRQGRGRPPARHAEAMVTQMLITQFIEYLDGGEAIARRDWQWLKALFETGLRCAGLVAPLATRQVGRPRTSMSEARALAQIKRAGLMPSSHGALAQAIGDAAADMVLRRRRVQAAWADRPFEQIEVHPNDPDVLAETRRIYSTYRSILHRQSPG